MRVSSEVLIVDCEADGLSPSSIHMIGVLDYFTDKFTAYIEDDVADGLVRVMEAKIIIGHNLLFYDVPVIRKLTEGIVDIPNNRIIDTLSMSRKVFPHQSKHSLREWGLLLNSPKGDFHKWDKFYPEMVPYCEQDCRLTKLLFDYLSERYNA